MKQKLRAMLKRRMDELGIETETKLAEIAGLEQSTVHRILNGENHNPTYQNLESLLNALELPCLDICLNPMDLMIVSRLRKLPEKYKKLLLNWIYSLEELAQTE